MTKCAHGLESSQCLICKTLGTVTSPPISTSEPPRGRVGRSRHPEASTRRDAVYSPASASTHQPRSLRVQLGLIIAGIVVLGVAVWLVAGVVVGLLHIAELVLVAAAAGWVGYRIGRYRGAHHRAER